MNRHALISLLLAGAVATSLVACGKKGDPVLPQGQKDKYPSSYPQSTQPQTGVFSG
jgi:predicted small lipoprotein YifL